LLLSGPRETSSSTRTGRRDTRAAAAARLKAATAEKKDCQGKYFLAFLTFFS
jgi:hypothetical protein